MAATRAGCVAPSFRSFLFLVIRMFLVVRPGAPRRVLAPSSKEFLVPSSKEAPSSPVRSP